MTADDYSGTGTYLFSSLLNPEQKGHLGLTGKEIFAIEAAALGGPELVALGLHTIRSGYSVNVAVHTIKAAACLGINISPNNFDESRFTLHRDVGKNDRIAIALARLAGRLVVSMQYQEELNIFLIRHGFANSPEIIKDEEKAKQALCDCRIRIERWKAWNEDLALIETVVDGLKSSLSGLAGQEEIKNSDLPQELSNITDYNDPRYDLVFHDYFTGYNIGSSVRHAERIIAYLEIQKLEDQKESFLFKKELEEEQERIRKWTGSTRQISWIKSGLLKSIKELIPKSDYSDED